ncbi:hypothetical protein ACJX0J_019237, partial [Zea mays]
KNLCFQIHCQVYCILNEFLAKFFSNKYHGNLLDWDASGHQISCHCRAFLWTMKRLTIFFSIDRNILGQAALSLDDLQELDEFSIAATAFDAIDVKEKEGVGQEGHKILLVVFFA